MNNLTEIKVCGVDVSFLLRKDVWVNATELAKGSGKRPVDWLRLPSTKEFLSALGNVRKSHILIQDDTIKTSVESRIFIQDEFGVFDDNSIKSEVLVRTVRGVHGGTWLHEDVAIEFARWLSPEFSIACNRVIKQLFREGHVDLNQIFSVSEQEGTKKLKKTPGFVVDDAYASVLPYLWEWINQYEIIPLPEDSDDYITSGTAYAMFKKFLQKKHVNTNRDLYVGRFLKEFGLPHLRGRKASQKLFFVKLKEK